MGLAESSHQLQIVNEAYSFDKRLRVFSPVGEFSSEAAHLAGDYLATRYEFVQRMGWLPNATDDVDAYDADPTTRYILRSNRENTTELKGGARLTKVADMDGSLSWKMLQESWHMQTAAADNEPAMRRYQRAAEHGTLWDLTRLILPVDGTIRDVTVDIIGASIAATLQEQSSDSSWLFLTSSAVKRYLDGLGIKSHIITSGKVSRGDVAESHFCIASTAETLLHTRQSKRTRERETYEGLADAINSF